MDSDTAPQSASSKRQLSSAILKEEVFVIENTNTKPSKHKYKSKFGTADARAWIRK